MSRGMIRMNAKARLERYVCFDDEELPPDLLSAVRASAGLQQQLEAEREQVAGLASELKAVLEVLDVNPPENLKIFLKAQQALATTPSQAADRWRKMEAVVEAAREQRKMSHKPMSGHYHAYLKAGMKLDTALAELDALEKEATPVETAT